MLKLKNLVVLIFIGIFLLPQMFFSVNICPPDKLRTEISIQHSRHPQNIPLGVLDNTIDVTITLNAIDRQTGKKIPLANKEVLIELVIGSKFITRTTDGSFTLSDEPSPFPLNTTEDGTISFTIYTQPPLLENVTDPRKISYSITASFTPKPKEPFMGSVKTERYVPGVVPIISMAACAPLFIIFALLIAAMFATGRNPFGLFDFSRVAFKAPVISAGRVTPRQKTTLAGVAVGAAQIAAQYGAKYGLYKMHKYISEKTEPIIEKRRVRFIRALENIVKTPGRILMTGASKRLSAEEYKKLLEAQKTAGRPLTTKEAEDILGKTGLMKGPLAPLGLMDFRIPEAPTFSLGSLFSIFKAAFGQQLGRFGVRPWSLTYAHPQPIKRPSEEKYTKEEQKGIIKKENESVPDANLTEKDVDVYGLKDSGKIKILEALGYMGKGTTLGTMKEIMDGLKKETTSLQFVEAMQKLQIILIDLQNQLKSPYLTPNEKSEIKDKIDKLSKTDVNKLLNNLEKIYNKELQNAMNRISSNGALIGFDKEKLILEGKILGMNYYKNYAIDEMTYKLMGGAGILAKVYGIPAEEIINAYKKGDIGTVNNLIRKTLDETKYDPQKISAVNYILKEVQIGVMMKYLDKLEIRDEKGQLIKDLDQKLKTFIKQSMPTETLTKNIIEKLSEEKKINSALINATKIVTGRKESEISIEDIYKTVMNGEENVKKRIETLEQELDDLKKKYSSSTSKSIDEDKIKAKEEEIKNAYSDLYTVQRGIKQITNERENVLLMKEIYDESIKLSMIVPEIDKVAEPTPQALFNLRRIGDAVAINDAAESTKGLISAIRYSERYTEEFNKRIDDFSNTILNTPYKNVNEVDKIAMEINNTLKGLKTPVLFGNTNNELFENNPKEQIEEKIKIIENEKSLDIYKQEIESMVKDLNKASKRIEDEIERHVDEQGKNPWVHAVDGIDHSNMNEEGINSGALKNAIGDERINDSIVYYYLSYQPVGQKDKEKYEKEKEKETENFAKAFYTVQREKPTGIKIEKMPGPTGVTIKKNGNKKNEKE